jgi:hypothetical protein
MTDVIREYGGVILAVAGGILLFSIIGQIFLSHEGILAQMIQVWGNGGC